MERTHFTLRSSFVLLLGLIQTTRGDICSGPLSVSMRENNNVDYLVANLTADPGVTMVVQPPFDSMLTIREKQLFATQAFDYETDDRPTVGIECRNPDGLTSTFYIVLILENVNEFPPAFGQSRYNLTVSEMTPVGTQVGQTFSAVDGDQTTRLFYRLTSETTSFRLKSVEEPDLIVNSILDYDTGRTITLVLEAQDTSPSDNTTLTGTTTIVVTVEDADNRPPWFQPCTRQSLGFTVVCINEGYTGSVDLNQTMTGPLTLEPAPLVAIDGDSGINESITYSILNGKDHFQIDPNSGEISMLKPVVSMDTIRLEVLAAQSRNPHQFAIATVTISVLVKSLHMPRFEKPSYQGVVSAVGDMARDGDEALHIHATDADYNGVPNPNLVYSIEGSSDFSIVKGFLFLIRELPPSNVSLRVVVRDTTNDESDTAALQVEVKTGLTTTTSMPTSTVFMTTTPKTTTPDGTMTPTTNTNTTPEGTMTPTTNPNTTPDGTTTPTTNTNTTPDGTDTTTNTTPEVTMTPTTMTPTTKPNPDGTITPNTSPTPDGTITPNTTPTPDGTTTPTTTTTTNPTPDGTDGTADTAHPPTVIVAVGGYGSGDMAALGATLGVLLFACLLVIGLLLHGQKKGKADWKKMYEVSLFRSTLGQGGSGGLKAGVQYTNEAFQSDEDGGSVGSGGSPEEKATQVKSTAPPPPPPTNAMLLDGASSEAGSDKGDGEKEVRPILTKERRTEEGYKAVWFKEDIDPNAKEEVLIIPDRRGEADDSEDDDEDDGHKTSSISFDDTDLDSGLGVRMGDSDNDAAMLTSDL